MMIFKMAFRNIFRQRRRSILTGLMMIGGTTLCALSLGLVDGMYGGIIDMFTRTHTGHIQVHKEGYLKRPSLYKTIDHSDRLMTEIRSIPHVESMVPRVYSASLAFVGSKTAATLLTGVDPYEEASSMSLEKKVEKGTYLSRTAANEILLGSGIAEILKVAPGDEVALIGQAADGSIANDLFIVKGILAKGGMLDKMNCYMHIRTAQQFLELGTRIHEIAVLLDDQEYSRSAALAIQDALGDPSLDVSPWQVVESQFYNAMQADLKGNNITMGVIIAIVAIGVLNTVLMSILERTKEFGVLRALGTRPKAAFFLIICETGFLAILSILVGTVIGLAGNYYLSIHGIMLPEPLAYGGMYWDSMTARISADTIWVPAVVTFFSAVLVSVIPAVRAARITPVKAMSTH